MQSIRLWGTSVRYPFARSPELFDRGCTFTNSQTSPVGAPTLDLFELPTQPSTNEAPSTPGLAYDRVPLGITRLLGHTFLSPLDQPVGSFSRVPGPLLAPPTSLPFAFDGQVMFSEVRLPLLNPCESLFLSETGKVVRTLRPARRTVFRPPVGTPTGGLYLEAFKQMLVYTHTEELFDKKVPNDSLLLPM